MRSHQPDPTSPRTFRGPRAALAVLAPLAVSAGLLGCSASAHISLGEKTLNNPDKVVSDGLLKSVGQRPTSVSCPSDVPAKKGHVFHCKVVINGAGDYVMATVTETSVSDNSASVDISDSTTVHKAGS